MVSSEFYWGSWLGYGWVVFSLHFRSFSLFVQVVYLAELVKYSLIERYLAAKIGTISVSWFGGSSSLRVIEVVF